MEWNFGSFASKNLRNRDPGPLVESKTNGTHHPGSFGVNDFINTDSGPIAELQTRIASVNMQYRAPSL